MMCSIGARVAQTRADAFSFGGAYAAGEILSAKNKKGELLVLTHPKLALPDDRIAYHDTDLSTRGFGRARVVCIGAWRHRAHDVFALFAIGLWHAQDHLVFVDAELRRFPHGEKRRVLIVFGPDAVDQPVALEDVFLAQDLLCVLMLAIC